MFCDLSSAEWSDMVPYGTQSAKAAVHQPLSNPANKLIILPSIIKSGAKQTTNKEPLPSEIDAGEHIGPTRSNHVSPIRIKLLSNSGQRVITGVFQAVTLVYRRVELPQTPVNASQTDGNTFTGEINCGTVLNVIRKEIEKYKISQHVIL